MFSSLGDACRTDGGTEHCCESGKSFGVACCPDEELYVAVSRVRFGLI